MKGKEEEEFIGLACALHESRLVTIINLEMEEIKCFSYCPVKVKRKNGKIIIPSGIFKEKIFLVNSGNVIVFLSNQVSEDEDNRILPSSGYRAKNIRQNYLCSNYNF